MRPLIHTQKEQASILVATILTIAVLMISLGAYLRLVSCQLTEARRSECWNMAITVAEAGIEEAHVHLSKNGLANLVSNGWLQTGTNTVNKIRYFGSNYFSVTITSNDPVRVVSQGAMWVPGGTSSNYIYRTVETAMVNPGILNNALLLLNTVSASGGNAYIDSFSSTNGPYTLAARRDHANIQCLGLSFGCVAVGNAQVYGKISTLPTGSITCNNGAVGDTNWVPVHQGIEPGWSDNNLKTFTVPNAPVAAFTGTAPFGDKNYAYILGNGQYYLNNLSLSGKSCMLVTGNAELHVTSTLKLAGQASIVIQTNASLTIFMDGPSASIAGLGIVNNTGLASKFIYYGSTNNTDIKISGNGDFCGVYYAPQADMKVSGNGSLTGCFVANNLDIVGNASIHYDEELSKLNVGNDEWKIQSWSEL